MDVDDICYFSGRYRIRYMIQRLRSRLRTYLARRMRVPSIESSLQRLAAAGFKPSSVYDVGAYKGEFAELALSVWPDTTVTCFEPQESRVADMEDLTRRTSSKVVYERCLLGAESQESVDFYLNETGSSVLPNSEGTQFPKTQIAMTTLDRYREHSSTRPCELLKLDVQGYELDVLRGAELTIKRETEVILAELNLIEVYQSVPLFDQVISWLADRGFVAYDISSLIRRPLDDTLWQADFVFVRTDGPFRRDKRWHEDIDSGQGPGI